MIPLVAVSSLLLLASGLVKVKAAARVGMRLPVLAAAELVLGVGICGLLVAARLTAAQGLLAVVGSVALILVSSLRMGAAVRRRQRLRSASEGTRLANYLKHVSRPEPPAGPGRGRAKPSERAR